MTFFHLTINVMSKGTRGDIHCWTPYIWCNLIYAFPIANLRNIILPPVFILTSGWSIMNLIII